MASYQLRLPLATAPGALLEAFAESFSRQLPQRGDPTALAQLLRRILEAYVLWCDLCGTQILCDETVAPAPWNPHRAPPSLGPDMEAQRIRLVLPADLEELSREVEEAVAQLVGPDPQVRAAAARALRDALGPYLYTNDVCGMTELCRCAQFDPVWEVPKHVAG